jgi:threonylcarbamoyladenosine tRNA methylthiotransferase MtaB
MREQLIAAGLVEVGRNTPADLYVINTCTVTHSADRESRYFIRRAHKENPKGKVIATGCYVQAQSKTSKGLSAVSHIVRNEDKTRISSLLKLVSAKTTKKIGQFSISYFKGHTRAFLKIQDGCVNLCSYCRVPLVRPRLYSRALLDIKQEAGRLLENGYKEIVLCGICLGAYGKDLNSDLDLVDVIEELEKLDGISRIRLSSIEAWDITDRLINKLAHSQKICPHLHIPIQSGDDTILRKMNRKATGKFYLKIINKLKKEIPNIAITTDVIVGFPGESDGNFKNTLDLIRGVEPLKVHIFPYSPRPGTAAIQFSKEVPLKEMGERLNLLKELAQDCSFRYKSRFLNQILSVLIEGCCKEKGYLSGLSDNYLKVLVKGDPCQKNKLISARLKEIRTEVVIAEYLQELAN